ncbi:hypothetical protein Vadar_033265 [Vaccinium darrowii]|uniref:Uncharacterized protein n=1 Tax=Vaccinium darrowii TaxID=229202 RepID=A0ACB7ZH30_9ERIC|nr:hypothetical protein Vadar_033265 [Vaccinium darrowii]
MGKEWNCGRGCFYAEAAAQVIPNRKVLHGSIMHVKEDAVSESAKVQGSATSTTGYGGGSENWELRRVPAGPDPLHHHGGSPKKPTTP